MAANNQDVYPLSRSKPESERLDQQHQVAVEIMSQLPRNCRVADIGTGTGVWPLHASRVLPPDAEMVGYDISRAQFPGEHPQNVRFANCDAKKPFPAAEHNKYDLVHMRALNLALQPNDISTVVKHAVELLKPGGALQWTEADLSRLHCLRAVSEPRQYGSLQQLLDRFEHVMGEKNATNWKIILGTSHQHGLTGVEHDMMSSDRVVSTRELATRSYSVMLLEWALKTQAWSPEDLDRLRDGVNNDIEHGAYLRVDCVTIVGFKP